MFFAGLPEVLREQYHLQLCPGAEQEAAWSAAVAKCSELKASAELSEAPRFAPTDLLTFQEMFCGISADTSEFLRIC